MGKVKQFAEMLEEIENIETERDIYKKELEKLKKEQEEKDDDRVMLEARCSWLVMELDAERKICRKLAEERDALQEENEKSKKLLLDFFRSKSDAWRFYLDISLIQF